MLHALPDLDMFTFAHEPFLFFLSADIPSLCHWEIEGQHDIAPIGGLVGQISQSSHDLA